jgi:hypothetical protein
MNEITRMLDAYNRDPHSLTAPDIPDAVWDFLAAGLISADVVDSRRSDPLLALGSDKTFRCTNAEGQTMMIQLWGNTDGWGMLVIN